MAESGSCSSNCSDAQHWCTSAATSRRRSWGGPWERPVHFRVCFLYTQTRTQLSFRPQAPSLSHLPCICRPPSALASPSFASPSTTSGGGGAGDRRGCCFMRLHRLPLCPAAQSDPASVHACLSPAQLATGRTALPINRSMWPMECTVTFACVPLSVTSGPAKCFPLRCCSASSSWLFFIRSSSF